MGISYMTWKHPKVTAKHVTTESEDGFGKARKKFSSQLCIERLLDLINKGRTGKRKKTRVTL